MRTSLLISVFFLAFLFESFGQTSGYMGKRWSLSGNFSNIIILDQPNHNYGYNGFPSFSIHYEAELDYCINRRTSMGLMFHRALTSAHIEYYEKLGSSFVVSDYDYLKIRGTAYGLNFKFFMRRGDLAPVGFYSKIGFGVLAYNYLPYDEDLMALKEPLKESGITSIFTLTLGKQRILFNNILLRGSVDLNFLPVPGGLSENDYGASSSYDNIAKDVALKRLFTYYLLNFNVGIGFLIPYRSTSK